MPPKRANSPARVRPPKTGSKAAAPSPLEPAQHNPGVDEPEYPEPVPWITTWPWRTWTRWQRSAVIGQVATKGVVGIASVVSAVILLLGLGPQAYDSIFWRKVEYDRLSSFHAGFNISVLYQSLGQPSIVTAVPKTSYTEAIFMRRQHLVMVISDKPGNVVLYSVTSCDPSFQPTFKTEASTAIRLLAYPLASVEVEAEDPELASKQNGQRQLSYGPPSTASSPDLLTEQDPDGMSNARRGRGYFVGINGLCADTSGLGADAFKGDLDKAPAQLQNGRNHIAANFFAETYGIYGTVSDFGAFTIATTSANPECTIYPTPLGFDLPFELYNPAGTRTFK